MALRDTMFGLLVSISVITGIVVYQSREKPVIAAAPFTALRTSTPVPKSQPAAIVPSQPDSAQLQSVLYEWQSEYPDAEFGVVVRELGGAQRSASLNADMPVEASSLYKLYLEDYIYTNIARGNISLDDSLGGPEDLSDCLNSMIVISDNACGQAIGDTIGWTTLNNFVHAAGFNETTETSGNTTTARDMADFLDQLQGGTLLRSDFSAQLVDNMEKQIYRQAIPAGDPGVNVADKVGFIDANWNDAAIVYGPKGTYILVVLSNNAGSAPIADLSQRVAAFMNQ